MDASQEHAEHVAGLAALADRLGQIIFRMDRPVREAMRLMQSDLERLKEMKDVLLAQIET
jgi:hypothetical protein